MATQRRVRRKLVEWLRRYGPLEVAGWISELTAAGLAYLWTDSLAVAAVAATVGSTIGYYLPAYARAVRWANREVADRPWPARTCIAQLLAIRSLTVEFGAAEIVDSVAVRPVLIYAGPVLLDHVLLGWIVGGFLADLVFYALAVSSYEMFKGLLAGRSRQLGEVPGGPVPSVAVA